MRRPILLGVQVVAIAAAASLGVLRIDGPAENPIKKADVNQKGRMLIVEMVTRPEVALSTLRRFPNTADARAAYLCAEFDRRSGGQTRRLCVGGEKDSRRAIGLSLVSAAGKVTAKSTVRATVKRATPHRVVISLPPGKADLRPGEYGWRALFADGKCEGGIECGYSLPANTLARYRVRPVDPVGCTGGNGQVVRRGPSAGRKVALTFDDGPVTYTAQILSILKRYKAKATFFSVGSVVRANPSIARRIVRQGHEIANHSYSHPMLPSRSELVSTNGVIREVTRFRPCLFRPPYGALDSRLARDVGAEKMKTVLWNVDTVDWRLPGSGSIASIAGGAGAGSIVLMHDGGGPRGQTVAALPSIISSLRSRGLKPVTVSKLLGSKVLYRPR